MLLNPLVLLPTALAAPAPAGSQDDGPPSVPVKKISDRSDSYTSAAKPSVPAVPAGSRTSMLGTSPLATVSASAVETDEPGLGPEDAAWLGAAGMIGLGAGGIALGAVAVFAYQQVKKNRAQKFVRDFEASMSSASTGFSGARDARARAQVLEGLLKYFRDLGLKDGQVPHLFSEAPLDTVALAALSEAFQAKYGFSLSLSYLVRLEGSLKAALATSSAEPSVPTLGGQYRLRREYVDYLVQGLVSSSTTSEAQIAEVHDALLAYYQVQGWGRMELLRDLMGRNSTAKDPALIGALRDGHFANSFRLHAWDTYYQQYHNNSPSDFSLRELAVLLGPLGQASPLNSDFRNALFAAAYPDPSRARQINTAGLKTYATQCFGDPPPAWAVDVLEAAVERYQGLSARVLALGREPLSIDLLRDIYFHSRLPPREAAEANFEAWLLNDTAYYKWNQVSLAINRLMGSGVSLDRSEYDQVLAQLNHIQALVRARRDWNDRQTFSNLIALAKAVAADPSPPAGIPRPPGTQGEAHQVNGPWILSVLVWMTDPDNERSVADYFRARTGQAVSGLGAMQGHRAALRWLHITLEARQHRTNHFDGVRPDAVMPLLVGLDDDFPNLTTTQADWEAWLGDHFGIRNGEPPSLGEKELALVKGILTGEESLHLNQTQPRAMLDSLQGLLRHWQGARRDELNRLRNANPDRWLDRLGALLGLDRRDDRESIQAWQADLEGSEGRMPAWKRQAVEVLALGHSNFSAWLAGQLSEEARGRFMNRADREDANLFPHLPDDHSDRLRAWAHAALLQDELRGGDAEKIVETWVKATTWMIDKPADRSAAQTRYKEELCRYLAGASANARGALVIQFGDSSSADSGPFRAGSESGMFRMSALVINPGLLQALQQHAVYLAPSTAAPLMVLPAYLRPSLTITRGR